MPITDNDLALFRERAKTELRSTGDVGRLAWDDVVEALCKEVARLRSVSKERGDCAQLREALLIVKKLFDGRIMFQSDICKAHKAVDAALAEPVRNCDVGTAEEQEVRFDGFCMAHKEIKEPGLKVCSDNCPFVKKGSCDLHWAQLPYEEGGAK